MILHDSKIEKYWLLTTVKELNLHRVKSCKIFSYSKRKELKMAARKCFYNEDYCFWNTFLRASRLVRVNLLIYIVCMRFDWYVSVYFYIDSHQDIHISLVLTKKYVLKSINFNFDNQKHQIILGASTMHLFICIVKSLKNKKLIDTYTGFCPQKK